MIKRRGSGILLHISSLPSPFGIGDLGPDAYRFADFLKETGQSYWQILPLNPTTTEGENRPYDSHSVFAGNPLLISPQLLFEEGLVTREEIENHPEFNEERVDYKPVTEFKYGLLEKAFRRRKTSIEKSDDFNKFCVDNASWLDDYTLYMSLCKHFGFSDWGLWPKELRERDPSALKKSRVQTSEETLRRKYYQYLFFKQWFSLRKYLRKLNIQIIGDMAIYVNYESADVWANPGMFKLDENKRPVFIAGVPPDYFSATGQLWGNPVYNWEKLKASDYEWWIRRLEQNLDLFDFVRLDHFRGFVAYWEVKAGEKTAIDGRWVDAPAEHFFNTLLKHFSCLSVIAEDLGTITPDVREMIEHFAFPGMKLLLFAFGDDMPTNPYIPHNVTRDTIAYTGTHDNNTALGWFENEADEEMKERFFKYIGRKIEAPEIHRELSRLVMASCANTAILPMQDILGLGEEARMNNPAKAAGNWEWRLQRTHLTQDVKSWLNDMTQIYGRS